VATSQGKSAMANKTKTIGLENVNHPGKITQVNADMYHAMRFALLKVLPKKSPGLTADEVREAVIAHLPQDLFPGGSRAGWWAKAVQLDLEAKGVIAREKTKPLRLHKT
jgi:hypothetical protein